MTPTTTTTQSPPPPSITLPLFPSPSKIRWVPEVAAGRPPKNCLVRVIQVPEDVSYSRGHLYLAGEQVLWVVHDILKPFSAAAGPIVKAFPFPKVVKSFQSPNKCCPPFSGNYPYLSHLNNGQVHVIFRDYGDDYLSDDRLTFHVFKLVADEGAGLDNVGNLHAPPPRRSTFWEEVRSLDGHAVFIGDHQSFSLTTTTTDQCNNAVTSTTTTTSSILNPNSGIRGDHIYSAKNRACWHRKSFRGSNLDGLFDLANQKFQRRYTNGASKNQKRKKKKGKKKKKQLGAASSQETATTSTINTS